MLGCSTGEEAYSLAIAFAEFAEAAGSTVPLQVFATDLNAAGIEKARAGVYPKDIAQDVSPERLRRFFAEVDGRYRISKPIRDICVFSRHNVLADPPFSHIDLISCRNLLIYLEPVLQQKIVPILHYALKPAGFLWLGGSETIGSYRDLFEVEDAKHKIYAKKPGSSPRHGHFPLQHGGAPRAAPSARSRRGRATAADLQREADRILSTEVRPARRAGRRRPGDPAVPRRHRPVPGAGAGQGQPEPAQDAPRRLLVAVRAAVAAGPARRRLRCGRRACASSPTAATARSTSR